MSVKSQKLLVQIAFNLFLILLFILVLVSVIRGLFSFTVNLGESFFILVFVGIILFIGISFLLRLIRESRQIE